MIVAVIVAELVCGLVRLSDPIRIVDAMTREFRSTDEARRAFDAYVRIEPQLAPLWDLCRRAAPPCELEDDDYETDPFEVDALASNKPADGWCAEDYFLEHVKPELLHLVGSYRLGELHELHGSGTYETLYHLLLDWALDRQCRCCVQGDDDEPRRGEHVSPAYC